MKTTKVKKMDPDDVGVWIGHGSLAALLLLFLVLVTSSVVEVIVIIIIIIWWSAAWKTRRLHGIRHKVLIIRIG